jgi:superfamily II DNA/RNA helicase
VPELVLSDLEPVEALVAACRSWSAAPEAKLAALRALVADGKPTLVFSTHTATVRHLRDHLGGRRVAWCTGREAGTRPRHPSPRRRPRLVPPARAPTDRLQARPTLLLATDVAAEGLDLRW